MTRNPNPLIERIRLGRIHRGLTTKALADLSKITVPTLRNWEEGRNAPHDALLGGVARALNVPLEWLLYGEGPNPFNENAPGATEANVQA